MGPSCPFQLEATKNMLHLYLLYACMHLAADKHTGQAASTRCDESEAFFQAEPCKKELPKKADRARKVSQYVWTWLECQDTQADSWIPADATDRGNRLYKAQASVSDEKALAALLAPLTAQARATLAPRDLEHPFQRTFQGPGNLSFFIVGTGSSVTAYAVTNLDDFQFTDMATDVSSAAAAMTLEKDLNFKTIAEDAGVELSHHTETSQRALPPPGGIAAEP